MQRIEISVEKVKKELLALQTHKAAGLDEIHPKLLKLLTDQAAEPLTHLFNECLQLGTLPKDWRRATVVPILKGGDPNSVKNYRPVSLTSVPCKMMGRIVRRRICEYLMNSGLFNAAQHGFIKRRSCSSNLLLTLDRITEALDEGKQVDVSYLDFQKAFNSVNHRFPIHKLKAYGIEERVCKWVQSFLIIIIIIIIDSNISVNHWCFTAIQP
jgi:hypothetical protein